MTLFLCFKQCSVGGLWPTKPHQEGFETSRSRGQPAGPLCWCSSQRAHDPPKAGEGVPSCPVCGQMVAQGHGRREQKKAGAQLASRSPVPGYWNHVLPACLAVSDQIAGLTTLSEQKRVRVSDHCFGIKGSKPRPFQSADPTSISEGGFGEPPRPQPAL